MKRGDLIKFRRYPYWSYRIYRIKDKIGNNVQIVPALQSNNYGMKEIPIETFNHPHLCIPLTKEEKEEFDKKEFQNACYHACSELSLLEEKLENLKKESDSHRLKGEISICLNKIHHIFDKIDNH